jgi:hypothetical protein
MSADVRLAMLNLRLRRQRVRIADERLLIRHIRGMRSCWSGDDDQLNGRMEVTVVVRSVS